MIQVSIALCVPYSLIDKLRLKLISEVEIFGIGSHSDSLEMAITEVMWFGRKTKIEILINDGDDRLLGSELLDGKILTIDYQKMDLTISNER